MREPSVAGQFYEASLDKLQEQLTACFNGKRGPGDLPIKRGKNPLFAAIVPHAGYMFSGECAAWAYKEIAESRFPRSFIILGPNHFGLGSGLSISDWKTPFGMVKTDKDLVIELKEKTELEIREQHHLTEHSIEVQLPMLQFANKDHLKDIRIVPISIGRDIDFSRLGSDIHKIIGKKDVSIIVSSDFTHYGSHYGYVPFSTDLPERITKLDKGAIELIMKYDTKGFRDYINKTGITICGYMPILVFLSILEHMEVKPAPELLMHYMSGDLTGEYANSVSYASIVFQ